jgi:hypothetical protein
MLRKIWLVPFRKNFLTGFSVLALVIVLGSCGLGPQAQEKKSTAIKDEKAFFPIGLIDIDVDDTRDFPEIAAAGFNVVQSYRFEGIPPWGWTDTQAIKYLDAARKAGLKVEVGIPQEAVQNPDVADEQDIALIRQRVRAVKDHPAVWGYMLYDEPEHIGGSGRTVPVVNPINFNNAYNAIKQLDPIHPVLVSANAEIDDTYPYLGVDTMMLQALMLPPGSYPYPWDKLENLREAHRSSLGTLVSKHKPFVLTVQAYNLANDPIMWPGILKDNPEAVGRYPTREEMRFIAYRFIILGAKGLFFASYKFYDDGKPLEDISRKGNPKQWKAVSSVAAELQSLTAILSAPRSEVQVITSPADIGVEFLLKSYQGRLYFIAVNTKEEEKLATFSFSEPLSTVKVLNESRRILPKGNSFSDNFAGYGVHVYEIEKR